jgi:DMSO/TMAO reductase YedYZ molybdopterin-dependent catalytic subunit
VFGEPGKISYDELVLAARNHGMPLEALLYERTPVGLHYLLTHFDIPQVDPAEWTLRIDGSVNAPLELTLDDLRSRPRVTQTVTMECAGNGRALMEPRPISQPWLHEAVGTAEWCGASLASLLDECDLSDAAVEVVVSSLDRGIDGGEEQSYARSLTLDEARRADVVLAYEMNGLALLPQHGAPLRLIVPGWYGMTNVKWISRISAVDQPFEGYQQSHAYVFRTDPDDAGTKMSRILPRALMIPPGIPDFPYRRRFLPVGRHRLEGKAWSGWAPIDGVQVSVDGGQTWAEAAVAPPTLGQWAWRSWSFEWDAADPGEHVLCCRARDAAGNDQAHFPTWNVGGYGNPAAQRVAVTVVAPAPDSTS